MINEFQRNAKYRGEGRAADLLERIYAHKKLTIFGPFALGGVVLLLFLIFGQNADKWTMARDSLILAAIMYGGVLLVLGTQLLNPFCKPKFMDFAIVFFTMGVGFGLVQQLLLFLLHLRDGYQIGLVGFCIIPSALALIQSKRK